MSTELCGSVYGCEYHGVEAFRGDEGHVVLRLKGKEERAREAVAAGDLLLLGVVIIFVVKREGLGGISVY